MDAQGPISIIIPAHNEQAVIRRSLDALLDGAEPGEVRIIVACNGCTDDTARIAREYGEPVCVVETDTASKIAALNLGDETATSFPRIYMDADVVLTIQAVRAITQVLRDGQYLAACPGLRMNYTGASPMVRGYYQVWTSLPYTREGMMGAGVYALSQLGRARFDRFPDIIADDGYIRALFRGAERTVVPEAVSVVQAPATLRDLVRIKTRSRLGFFQLRERFAELTRQEAREKNYSGAIRLVLSQPSLWLGAVAYLWVNVASRVRAKRQLATLANYRWERDESSRSAAKPASNPS